MSMWTAEQKQAIELDGKNLLVAAAAGSGKTAVLVERIIQKLCDEIKPLDVDKLLVVTFTNAAAAEMKEKIGQALHKAIKKNPADENIYRQLNLLNNASITTLHSFCLEIVRENFFVLEIDPNFRIANDTEAELLRLDAADQLLEEYYLKSAEDNLFLKLVDAYGGEKDDSQIKDFILSLYEFSRSNPWPHEWLDESIETLGTTDWFNYLIPIIKAELLECKGLLTKARVKVHSPDGPLVYETIIAKELAYVEDLIIAINNSWDSIYDFLEEMSFTRMPTIKKDQVVDLDLKEDVQSLRNDVKKKLEKLKDKYFSQSPQELMDHIILIQPEMKTLTQLVKDYKDVYWEKKLQRNVLDFTDLEHLCLQVLIDKESTAKDISPSKLCLRLKERYVEVLVDEYQDINDVQETILSLVSKNNNRFMVGDVKQSIYRFRLANPDLFLKKYQDYKSSGQNVRVDLSKNFRCREEIVDGVNFIFRQIMNPDLGKIEYDDKAKLVLGANYPEIEEGGSIKGTIEVHIVDKKTEDELGYLQKEALIVGEKIKELIRKEAKIFDKDINDYRKLTYRDIVILFRSPKASAETFVEELRALDIPVYAELGSGYFDAIEIKIMLSLLQTIDNPYQDIPLASVLRSPLVALDTEELSTIAINNKNKCFFEAVKITANQDETKLSQKLNEFLSNLDRWRTEARQGDLASLIWDLFIETGYYDYVGAMPGGIQRQANLRVLFDRAREYEETSFRGLFMFLRFIDKLRENKGDMEKARALGENENLVRIMSIHKSKGLEFPLVFVAGLGKGFNFQDLRKDIILDKDLGLGPMFVDTEKRIKYPTIAKLAIENKLKLETLSEELRVLYVALTRSKERLILVGSISNIDKTKEKWQQLIDSEKDSLTFYNLVNSNCYLDWIGPSLIRHEDGKLLRGENAHLPGLILKDDSRWQIYLYQSEQESQEKELKTLQHQVVTKINEYKSLDSDETSKRKVSERLDWQYPYQDSIGKSAKLSVTEITTKFKKDLTEKKEKTKSYTSCKRRPTFIQKTKELTALEKGSAIHLVMQHIDLKREITLDYLEELANFLLAKELIIEESLNTVNLELIINFFNSELGKRMKQARIVERELPFSLSLPSNLYYEDVENEKILVQGIIDCLWKEEQGYILLDYKSDYATLHNVDEIINNYAEQVNLYAVAIEKILKEPVIEKYIYLFSLNRAIKM